MNIFNTRDIEGNEDTEGYSSAVSSESDDIYMPEEPVLVGSAPQPEPENLSTSHLQSKIVKALEYFDSINLKVDEFLDGFLWGDYACTRNSKIRIERKVFFASPKLLSIIQCWAIPPRQKDSSHARATGGSVTMNKFALQHVCHLVNRELEDLKPYLESPTSVDIDKKTLTETSFENLSSKMQSVIPTLWQILDSFVYREGQKERNQHKSSLKVSMAVVYMKPCPNT